MRNFLTEAILVAVVGAAVSFAANALSPRGLKLNRDFFGTGTQNKRAPGQATNGPALTATNAAATIELLKARLESEGLQLAGSNRVIELFHDPRVEQGLVVFVDAREDAHYQEGHVPGAYQFDYYHVENFLPTILPICQVAQEIVIYCNGGNCEDSELAAKFLSAAGIPKEKLLVYGGGMAEWATNGLPVEVGERQSGQLRDAQPSRAK